MATFRDAILGPLDTVRSIGGLLGLRVFSVTVRVRTWDGDRPGDGAYTDVDTQLVNRIQATGQTYPVRLRQLTRREVIASGGTYADRDVRVGPMTPPYPPGIFQTGGGYDDSTLNTQPNGADAPIEVFWLVQADLQGWPAGGGWADLVGEEYTALHAYVILRANGRKP